MFRYLCREILQNEVFNGQFNESGAVCATAEKKRKRRQTPGKKWSKEG